MHMQITEQGLFERFIAMTGLWRNRFRCRLRESVDGGHAHQAEEAEHCHRGADITQPTNHAP